jgi:hypothetical protein
MTAQPAVMAEPQVINPSRFTNYGQGNGGGFGGQQFGQQPSNLMTPKQFFDGGFKDPRFNPSQPQQQQPSTGGGQQASMPSFAITTQQDMMGGGGRGGSGGSFGDFLQRSLGGGFGGGQQQQPFTPFGSGRGSEITSNPYAPVSEEQRRAHLGMFSQQQPDPTVAASFHDMQYRPQMEPQFNPYQQQPFGPQGGMAYSPQDQQRHQAMYAQRQMMEQALGRPSPFRQNPYQRQFGGGIQGLMGILGGRGGMGVASEADFEALRNRNRNQVSSQVMSRLQQPMTMDMPQYQGRSFDLPTNFMKNGGKV